MTAKTLPMTYEITTVMYNQPQVKTLGLPGTWIFRSVDIDFGWDLYHEVGVKILSGTGKNIHYLLPTENIGNTGTANTDTYVRGSNGAHSYDLGGFELVSPEEMTITLLSFDQIESHSVFLLFHLEG